MNTNKNILLAFYGDDFTGSTDALEFITRAGTNAVLFIEPPTPQQLQKFSGLDVIGVAGKTRALPPAEMEKILLPAFEQLRETGAQQVHYKVCSTFDSSITTGSIGKAIDCGSIVFKNKIIPVLGGMPALGRYCVFGNLFAQMGIGSNGKIYRLDKHPSMSKHPITPAHESDLSLHLGKQTNKKFGLIDVLQIDKSVDEFDNIFKDEEVILIDALYESQLLNIGRWLDKLGSDSTQFSVGGSGIEAALGDVWNEKRIVNRRDEWNAIERINPMLVISGSCSPVTAAQVEWAKANGFEEVIVDALKVCNDGSICGSVNEIVKNILNKAHNVIVHTGAKQEKNLSSEKLGTALGTIAKEAVMYTSVRRVVVAGGDTSSYVVRAMEIDAVKMIAPLVSGAPLCRAYSANKRIDGLEGNFKGGQVGTENYFGLAIG